MKAFHWVPVVLFAAVVTFELSEGLANSAGISVELPSAELRGTFSRDAVLVEPPSGGPADVGAGSIESLGSRAKPEDPAAPPWTWSWRTMAWGRPAAMRSVTPLEPVRTSKGVEYRRGTLIEWYEVREGTFEQGFTLSDPPPGSGRLVIEGRIQAPALRPEPSNEGIDFFDGHGVPRVRYDQLVAVDRDGRQLPARFDMEHGGRETVLRIEVDDAGARYPIVVDPIVSTPAWQRDGNNVGAGFGGVATAGDVNGDGYSDFLVGATRYTGTITRQGAAYLYLGSAGGLSTSTAWSKVGTQVNEFFGIVATAGDVNGDGYDDVLVGAPNYDGSNTDEGRAYLYLGSPTGLSTSSAWRYDGGRDAAHFGHSVATAGDINRDGYDDVIVGATGWGNLQGPNLGRAYLFLGGPSGLPINPDWTYTGSQGGTYLGWSVATAGDVDADGYSDVIVGSDAFICYCFHGSRDGLESTPRWTGAGLETGGTAGDVDGDGYADVIVGDFSYDNNRGRAFLYRGGSNGLSALISWSYQGTQATERMGIEVGTAGDVNGDGYADVIVGANTYTDGQSQEGRALVFQGSAGGLSSTPIWTEEGNQADCNYGARVATAGDVNGDGLSDIAVGAPDYDAGQTGEGRAYVYSGISGDLSANASWIEDANQVGAGLGVSVRSAGDVNGDGFSDLYVGAWHYDNGQSNEGRAFVFHGRASGLPGAPNWSAEGDQTNVQFGCAGGGIGDVNGDGYSDLAVGAYGYSGAGGNVNGMVRVYQGSSTGLEATPAWEQYGEGNNSLYGWSVAGAGDVNADGYADLLVGHPQWDSAGQQDRGRALLYLGSASGLATAPAWIFEGPNAGALLGLSVAGAGDVNSDGYSDIVVGAPDYANGQPGEGGAFLFLGSASGPPHSPSWSREGNQALGAYGFSVTGAGDIDGDGYADVVIADPAYDEGEADEGKVYVYMGSAGGLGLSPAATFQVNQTGASFGYTVAGAGDVNGDGYADFAVGMPNVDFFDVNEGGVYVYVGGPAGPTLAWGDFSDQDYAHFGLGLGPAGDVNGDGFADLAIGAPDYNGGFDTEGRVSLYLGNEGDGLDRMPRQLGADGTTPVDLLGRSDAVDSFDLALRGRTPAGRGLVSWVWEVKPLGTPFDGQGLGTGAVLRTGAPVAGQGSYASFSESVTGLNPDTPYCWRARLVSDSPFFPGSIWFMHAGNSRSETDLRTALVASAIEETPGSGKLPSLGAGPNPFAERLSVRFELPQAGWTNLRVYDVQGRTIAVLADGLRPAGAQVVHWDGRTSTGRRAPAGAYFLRLTAPGRNGTIEVRLAR